MKSMEGGNSSLVRSQYSNQKRGGILTMNVPIGVISLLYLMVSTLWLSGCATTNRTKTLLTMAGAGIVASAIGYATAPEKTDPAMHALFWAGIGSASAGAASLFIFDEQKRSEDLERKMTVSQKELDALRGESVGSEPKLLYETSAPFGKEVPDEYQSLVNPGRWSVYKLNQWVLQGETTLIHQDRMITLIPPKFSPKKTEETSSLPQSKGVH